MNAVTRIDDAPRDLEVHSGGTGVLQTTDLGRPLFCYPSLLIALGRCVLLLPRKNGGGKRSVGPTGDQRVLLASLLDSRTGTRSLSIPMHNLGGNVMMV